MNNNLRRLVRAVPFVPFAIHLADGSQLRVPSVDRIAVSPAGDRIWVFRNDGEYEILSSLLITRITVDATESRPGEAA